MIRFAAGLALIIFTVIVGVYKYLDISQTYQRQQAALADALEKRDQGKNLQQRIRVVRTTSLETKAVETYKLASMLDVPTPRMEMRIVGQPLVRGTNKSLYRYNFRITGPGTHAEAQKLLERMVKLPGFIAYRYCLACSNTPRGTDPALVMVLMEGYLYAYDPDKLY